MTSEVNVSKLFRAYGLYNNKIDNIKLLPIIKFQSSFELTGYITTFIVKVGAIVIKVSKLFRAYGLYN